MQVGYGFAEGDDLALRQSKRSNVNEIFKLDGEARWRELEIMVAKKLRTADKTIIATGGGAVMNQIIFTYLKQQPNTIVVYLAAKFSTVQRRLRGDKTRPLFQNIQKARALYELREPLYRHYADITVNTDRRALDSIVKDTIGKLKNL